MKNFKKLLLLTAVLFSAQIFFAQDDAKMQRQSEECEKLFGKKMKQLQDYIESKEMSPREANDYVQAKIESMKQAHPECFPDVDMKEVEHAEEEYQKQVRNKKKYHGVAAEKMKIDSENLSDAQISEIDKRYREAQKQCRKELKAEVEKIRATVSKARTGAERLKMKKEIDKETRLMVHQCTLDKMVASF